MYGNSVDKPVKLSPLADKLKLLWTSAIWPVYLSMGMCQILLVLIGRASIPMTVYNTGVKKFHSPARIGE